MNAILIKFVLLNCLQQKGLVPESAKLSEKLHQGLLLKFREWRVNHSVAINYKLYTQFLPVRMQGLKAAPDDYSITCKSVSMQRGVEFEYSVSIVCIDFETPVCLQLAVASPKRALVI